MGLLGREGSQRLVRILIRKKAEKVMLKNTKARAMLVMGTLAEACGRIMAVIRAGRRRN